MKRKKLRIRLTALVLAVLIVSSMLPASAADSGFALLPPDMAREEAIDYGGPVGLAVETADENRESGLGAAVTGQDLNSEHASGKWYQIAKEQAESETVGTAAETERFSSSEAACPYGPEDQVTFIVKTRQMPLMQIYTVSAISSQTTAVQNSDRVLKAALDSVARDVENVLEGDCEFGYSYTVATTGFSVTTSYGNREAIEALPGVESVYVAPIFRLLDEDAASTGLLTPYSGNSTGMIGADIANSSGYTGKGTKIAIVDTGLKLDHRSFPKLSDDKLTDDSLTLEKIRDLWPKLHGGKNTDPVTKTNADKVYYSTKIPFEYNYIFPNLDADHLTAGSDHGTHVAGIAAGVENYFEGKKVRGVAPDAQICVMQVFGNGGAEWTHILAALEDCVVLGVDAVNLSLGSSAGFTDAEAEENMTEVLKGFETAGIQMLAAAGNDSSSSYGNMTGQNLNPVESPDTGIVGSPSTFTTAVAVASADNNKTTATVITCGDRQIPVTDTATWPINRLSSLGGSKEYTFVYAGHGTAQDYTEVQAKGKTISGSIVLVERGESSFQEKQEAARKANAKACIVFNNEPGTISMQIKNGQYEIPCVSISQKDGKYLVEQEKAGNNTLTISKEEQEQIINTSVSSFSSWGATPDLKLKPEVTGVGGNILSSVDPRISGRPGINSADPGKDYAVMSGTSMATPQITGAAAVIRQYLKENFKSLSAAELGRMSLNLMMSTADPLLTDDGVEFSPRRQGSGLINLGKATTALAYLTNDANPDGRPKAELGSSTVGTWEFTFQIHNVSEEDQVYIFDSSLLTETIRTVSGKDYILGSPSKLNTKVRISEGLNTLWADFDGDHDTDTEDAWRLLRHVLNEEKLEDRYLASADLNGDGAVDEKDVSAITDYCAELNTLLNAVTVPAGGEVTLKAKIRVEDAEDIAQLKKFPAGIFVEGFLYATRLTKDGEGNSDFRLTMPMLGFYGDWSEPELFDDLDDPVMYPRYFYAFYHQLNMNPYILSSTRYGDEYNAFSQDNFLYELDFGMMRGAKRIHLKVQDKNNNLNTLFENDVMYVPKSYYDSSYGMVVPAFIYERDVLWKGSEGYKDGTSIRYTVDGYLDDGNDVSDGTFSFDAIIDTGYPVVPDITDANVTEENGRRTLTVTMSDNHNIAAILFATPHDVIMGKFDAPVGADGKFEPNHEYQVSYDITGFGSEFKVIVADYALNETIKNVALEKEEGDIEARELSNGLLYGSETYSQGILQYGWLSTDKIEVGKGIRNETFDYNRYNAAEYVNGRIIAQNCDTGDLVAVTPYSSYWKEQTLLHQSAAVGKQDTWQLYDIAMNYATNKMYAVGWRFAGADLNQDGDDDGVNMLYEIDFSGKHVKMQEIAQISGVDAGTNLLTLACNGKGEFYGINNFCKLYRLNIGTNSAKCELIADTKVAGSANVIQSMCFDLNDPANEKLYWSYVHSDGSHSATALTTMFYEVDTKSAKVTPLGSWGPSEPCGIFIPNGKKSTIFTLGSTPQDFEFPNSSALMIAGQEKEMEIDWLPWYSEQPTEVNWSSNDPSIVSVNEKGILTAKKEGDTDISVIAQCGGQQIKHELHIKVVKSAGTITGFMVIDLKDGLPSTADQAASQWIQYSDLDPKSTTNLGDQVILKSNPALWQGGAYYKGKLYLTTAGTYGSEIYTCEVEQDANGKVTKIGDPVHFMDSVTYMGNFSIDYPNDRLVYKNLAGGLGAIDLETKQETQIANYKLEGLSTSTDMCVMANGKAVVSDTIGNVYVVDPAKGTTVKVLSLGIDTLDYGSMYYDHNNGVVYWAPADRYSPDPCFYALWIGAERADGTYECLYENLGTVNTNRSCEQTVLFTIPEVEPEPGYWPIEGVTINQADPANGVVGGSVTLDYTLSPSTATVGDATWTSSDESVVTVDQSGKVSFVGAGEATVTLTLAPAKEGEKSHSDSIRFYIHEASKDPVYAFIHDDYAGHQNIWASMSDSDFESATELTNATNVNFYSGTWVNGYFYGYDRDGKFWKVKDNFSDSEQLGTWGNEFEVTSVAYDTTKNQLYGCTLDHKLVDINMKTGEATLHEGFSESYGNYVCSIAVDKNGTIWGVGSATSSGRHGLAVTYYYNGHSFQTKTGFGLMGDVKQEISATHGSIRPQLAYDSDNNCLYLYGPRYNASGNVLACAKVSETGIGIESVHEVGDIALANTAPSHKTELGLLAFVPQEKDDSGSTEVTP